MASVCTEASQLTGEEKDGSTALTDPNITRTGAGPPSHATSAPRLSQLHSEARCDRPATDPKNRPCRLRESRPAFRTLPLNSGWRYDMFDTLNDHQAECRIGNTRI